MVNKQSPYGEQKNEGHQPHQHVNNKVTDMSIRFATDDDGKVNSNTEARNYEDH